jgi:hypothetical protein
MKNSMAFLSLLFIICMAFMTGTFKPGIHGVIDPADGASKVWAIRGTDSISAIPASGKFSMEVSPGNWTILVEAVSPFQNAVVNNIVVLENQSTDAGIIKLVK